MIHALMLSMALVGCVEDVAKDKTEAVVSEAKKVEAPAPAAAAKAKTLKVDVAKSTIHALGAKVTATHPITFPKFEGKLMMEGTDLKGVNFTIQMEAMESDDPRLTKHLMNEDFFDVPNHPTATFVSTAVTGTGSNVEVEGNMTIRGNAKSIKFPATVGQDGAMTMAKAEFALNRQDFKVSYPGKKDNLIQDKVLMTISLAAQ